jgi:ketosteroid isomerase-like protein
MSQTTGSLNIPSKSPRVFTMRLLTMLSIAVAATALNACRPQAAKFTDEDEASIRRMFDARVASIRAGDWVKWSTQHADSIIIQPAHAPTIRGRAAILAWGQTFPPIDSLGLSDIRIWGEGNLAYATSAYALKLKDLPMDKGKELLVFRRIRGQDWQVVAFSLSSDLPPSAPLVSNPSANLR